MPTMKMTPRAVAALPAPDPSGKQTLYWAAGTATPGLGILVSGVSAGKSWVAQGNVNGKSVRLTLGPVAVLTIEAAWEAAKVKLAEMLQGRDPRRSVPQRALAQMTTREVLEEYLASSSNLRPRTIASYRAFAERHLTPWLDRPLRSIDGDAVETRFREIAREVAGRREAGEIKGGVNVDGRATANMALQIFRSLWLHQAERDDSLPKNNPTARLKRQWHALDRRTRHIPAEDLARFYEAARHLPSDIQRDMVILGLFTGLRESNVAGLRWDEVDLGSRMLRLPAGRMKGKKALDLPLSDVVHRMLVARRAIGREGQYVFPNHRNDSKMGYCASFSFALRQIEEKTGIKVSPHDLRRTYASIAATCEIPPVALKMLLAHSTGNDVTMGYVQLSQADFRAAVQKVADKLKELCGIDQLAGENVTQLA
jgi:integrase